MSLYSVLSKHISIKIPEALLGDEFIKSLTGIILSENIKLISSVTKTISFAFIVEFLKRIYIIRMLKDALDIAYTSWTGNALRFWDRDLNIT